MGELRDVKGLDVLFVIGGPGDVSIHGVGEEDLLYQYSVV